MKISSTHSLLQPSSSVRHRCHPYHLPPPPHHNFTSSVFLRRCTQQYPSDLNSSIATFPKKLPLHDEEYCIGKEEENPCKDGEASWPTDLLSEVSHNPQTSPKLNPNSSDHQHEHEDMHAIVYASDPMNSIDDAIQKRKNSGLCKISTLDSDCEANPSMAQINSTNGDADPVRKRVSENQIKLMCSFGGKIMPRPIDGKLRYVGGDTRIVNIDRGTSFSDFMSKMIGYFCISDSDIIWPLRIKYQLPNEDLDALISVSSDDDMQNMIEECEKVSGSTSNRLRLFFFSSATDVDVVAELKSGVEIGLYGDSSSPEQRYVNAINGNLSMNTNEEAVVIRAAGSHHQQQEAVYGRITCFKDADNISNVVSHSRSPSTPISAPSSPSLAPHSKSGFVGIDASLQGLREQLSKVAINSRHFEGDFDNQFADESASSNSNASHHEPQWYMASESPKILPHDLPLPQSRLSNCHCKHGMDYVRPIDRHHDQQFGCLGPDSPRMVHRDLPVPNNTSGGNTMEHWHDISHKQLALPLKHSISQLQLSQQLDQQSVWYRQSDLADSGNVEYHMTDLHYKQAHSLDRLHHQSAHDFLSPNKSGHDVSYRNAEDHGKQAPFVQVSPRKHTQAAMHGSSPPFAYHISSSRSSSPRLNGATDNPLKCSCGLQNSQVHRGVTSAIGDQSCNAWSPHVNGDIQSMRKNGCRPFSRFCDNVNHTIDSHLPHQPVLRTTEIECRDHQIGSSWYHVHRKASRDYQTSEYQVRDCALHYADISPQHSNFIPPSHKCYSTRKHCFCVTCSDRNQCVVKGDTGEGDSSFTNRKDQAPVSNRQSKEFELSKESFAEVLICKGEDFENSVGEKCVENKYGVVYSSKVQVGGLEERGVIEAHNEEVAYDRRPLVLPSGLTRPPKELAGDILEENSTTSPVHTWVENAMLSYAHGETHLLCPDVIPLGSLAITEESAYIVQMADSVAISTLTVDDNCLNVPVSPVYDKTPQHSVHSTPFSFTPSNEGSPRTELDDVNEELFNSQISGTKLLADGMISLILDSSSNEGVFLEEDKELEDSSSNGGIFFEEEKEFEGSLSNERIFLADEKELEESSSNRAIFPEEDKDNDSLIVEEQSRIDITKNEIEMPGNSNTQGSLFNPKAAQAKDSLVIVSSTWMKLETEEKSETVLRHESAEKLGFKEFQSEQKDTEEVAERRELQVEEEARARGHGLQIIPNSDLEDLKELGSGTFGTVFHGKWRGSDVAIKRIRASCFTDDVSQRERLINDFWKEACTLGQLHHPNVVAFYGVVPDGPGGTLGTVTEYMVNGSLKQVLHKKDRTIDRRKRLFIAMDAAFGMEYLHSKNIVHFDLKCENLLVNMRDAHRPICKVGDFGLSKVKHQTLVSGGVRGTLPWMAPELLSGNANMVTEKVDVFSFGVVMWELLTGEEPYASLHCGAIIGGIVNNTLRPSIPNWCDPGWRNLMEQCWSGDPSQRPAFSDVARELRAIAASMNMK